MYSQKFINVHIQRNYSSIGQPKGNHARQRLQRVLLWTYYLQICANKPHSLSLHDTHAQMQTFLCRIWSFYKHTHTRAHYPNGAYLCSWATFHCSSSRCCCCMAGVSVLYFFIFTLIFFQFECNFFFFDFTIISLFDIFSRH